VKRLLVTLLLVCAAGPARAQLGCEPARTALVLAGGGAKGLAHIGLLRSLDSLGVVPDLIVGTSMGAIVGALYASGLNAAEVERALRDEHLEAIIRDYDPVVSASLEGLQPAIVWEKQGARWVIQTGAVREGEVSAALARVMLRGNLLARGDFDSLPIPFRAVATELADRRVVSLGRGDLARAVRASMSIPLILRPVQIDGRSLVDGGLSSNIPVGIARSLGAERVIASTIASPLPDAADFDNPLTVTSALFEYLWVQDSLGLGPNDVRVAMPTADFDALDFSPAAFDTLIATGRLAADAALGAAACLRPVRASRVLPMLPTRIERTRVLPATIREREAVLRELGLGNRRPLDLDATMDGLARLARNERYRSVWIAPTGNATDVNMDVAVEVAPQKSFGLGAAFDHTMSGRLWIGGVDRSLLGRDLEGTAILTSGTYRRDLTLAARRRARVGASYVPIGVSAELAAEDLRVFDAIGELPTVTADEQALVIGVRPLLEPGWSQEFGLDARYWRVARTARQGHLGLRYAVRLRQAGAPQPLIALEAIASPEWQRVRLDVTRAFSKGPVTLSPRTRVGWGSALPLSQTFTLGGLDGFAGLRMLEGRGDHELFASLLVRWRLWRGVHARVEPMAGLMGSGDWHSDSLHLQGIVLGGARVGVDLETPLGPIRLEQGFNNLNRRQALIRVGRWF